MKIYTLPLQMVDALRSWFHPKDRSVMLAPGTFIEGEEIVTPAHPIPPGNPAHNRGLLYWKNGCWTQLDEFGNERGFCVGDWQSWTPTVQQSGSVAVTVAYAKYTTVNDLVILNANLAITGTGTAGNAIVISGIPAAVQIETAGLDFAIGSVIVLDTSVPVRYEGSVTPFGASDLRFRSNGNAGLIGAQPSFGLASGDTIGFTVSYKRA